MARQLCDRVMEPILRGSRSVMSGHTLSANPLSATALAVIEYMEKHNLPENSRKGRVFNKRLTESSATIDNHC